MTQCLVFLRSCESDTRLHIERSSCLISPPHVVPGPTPFKIFRLSVSQFRPAVSCMVVNLKPHLGIPADFRFKTTKEHACTTTVRKARRGSGCAVEPADRWDAGESGISSASRRPDLQQWGAGNGLGRRGEAQVPRGAGFMRFPLPSRDSGGKRELTRVGYGAEDEQEQSP